MKRFASALAGLVFASTVFAASPSDGGNHGRNVFRNCTRDTPVCAVILSVSSAKTTTGGTPIETKYLNPGEQYYFKGNHFAVGAVYAADLCENGRPCKCSHNIIIPSTPGNCFGSPSESEVIQSANATANGHGRGLVLRCSR